MDKSTAIMELVSGYDEYAEVEELEQSAATDAPATTHYCAAAALTWLTGQAVSKTIDDGC